MRVPVTASVSVENKGRFVRRRKKFKRDLEVILADGVYHFARHLPRKAGFRIFSALGDTFWWLLRKDRERALQNLEIAFPDAPEPARRAIARGMFKLIGQNTFEFLNLEGSSPERVTSLIERVEGKEQVKVSFRDTGQGLKEEVKQKLFEPYFSTKTTGTGLGLAICRSLSREMGGDVVVSNVEGGVEATLYLSA